MSSKECWKNPDLGRPNRELRVLLIDDQWEAVLPLMHILERIGVSAVVVGDGFTARRVLGERNFDLVIVDWNMPDINGAECLSFADTTLYLQERARRPMPYVTYSGLQEDQIQVPDTVFFQHIAHWPKSLGVSNLTRTILRTLDLVR